VSLSPGDLVDQKYRIDRELGAGGMGAVYLAENVRIQRRVAIKVLHPGADRETVRRFEREAQAAGRIGCRHIVEVFDLGDLPDGAPYMVMEYLEGETLAQRLESGEKLSPEDLLPIAHELLEGLKAAHGAGIVHRDLKPENVFLVRGDDGRESVKILDFGISKFQDPGGDALDLTRPGFAIGTPHYMSPEQATGSKHIDHRADLYSAGVILYRCLSGRFPFDAETVRELVFKVVSRTAPELRVHAPDLDPAWSVLVSRAMAHSPDDRFQSAEDFQRALWRATPRPAEYADTLLHVARRGAIDGGPRSSTIGSSVLGVRPRAGQHRRGMFRAVVLAIVAGLIGGAGAMLWLRWNASPGGVLRAGSAKNAESASPAATPSAIPALIPPPSAVSSDAPPSASAPPLAVSAPSAAKPGRVPGPQLTKPTPKSGSKSGPLVKDL
jgi:eukaryotic-like serine/threonine-protein kinase